MTAIILEALASYAAPIVAAVVALFAGWIALARRDDGIRKQERAKQREEAVEAHIETRKEIDHAISDSRASGATWADRLRQHRSKR